MVAHSESAVSAGIVTEVARGPAGPRFGRALVRGFGYLLVFAALLAAIPTLGIAILGAFGLATGGDLTVELVLVFLGFLAGSLLLLIFGLKLARGQRHLVLFLRRFGFDEAFETVTYAVGTAVGREWRLVTLDDSRAKPSGPGGRARVAWRIVRWTSLLLFLLALGYGVYWMYGGGADDFAGGIIGGADTEGTNFLEQIVLIFVLALVAAVIMAILIVLFVFFVLATLLVAVILSWRVDGSLRRAERAKHRRVLARDQVAGAVRRIRREAGRIFAPRFAVVDVADTIWRDVVRELAEVASVVIIDVSEPSTNIEWEIATLQRQDQARLVLIGRRDRAEALLAGTLPGAGPGLRSLLATEQILAYEDPSDRAEMRRFARNLGRMFEAERAA